METKKNHEYEDYPDDEEETLDLEDLTDSEIDLDDVDDKSLKQRAGHIRFRRTWRDTEKYKEIRELYKIINDELYTGAFEERFFDEGEYK